MNIGMKDAMGRKLELICFAIFMTYISRGFCIKCYICGGLETDDQTAYLPCHGQGHSIRCHSNGACTKIHFHLTEPVDDHMEFETMGCSFLNDYVEICKHTPEWLGTQLDLPLKDFACYHCDDADDCNKKPVNEMQVTVDKRDDENHDAAEHGEQRPFNYILKCIHCGLFDPDDLRSIRACTEEQTIKLCESTAEVCGLIYFQLREPPDMCCSPCSKGNKISVLLFCEDERENMDRTVFQVKQCIHKTRYRKKFRFWSKRSSKLKTQEFKCFYCEKDGCNINMDFMKDILKEAGATYNSLALKALMPCLFATYL